jgi:murein DD-endopeptidase MepM/ murein hydrolase activator NlpD
VFRRRQPALIASLAAVVSTGLVVPAASAGVPVQALAASQVRAVGAVGPAVAALGVVADAPATPAPGEPGAESGDDPASPAPEDDAPTTSAPDQDPTETSTTVPAPTTTVAPEAGTTTTPPPTTTTPVDEPTGDDDTTDTSTTVAATDTSTTVAATDTPTTLPVDEPVDDPPIETTTSTTTSTTPTTTPDDDPACESSDTTAMVSGAELDATAATTSPDDDADAAAPTTIAPIDEPGCGPTTTVPNENDEPTTTTTTTVPTTTTTTTTVPATTTTTTTTTTVAPAPADESAADADGSTSLPGDDGDDGTPDLVAAVEEPAEPVGDSGATYADATSIGPLVPSSTWIDTTPAELNVYDPGLRASSYDGVYAEGVPVGVAMATTRWLESRNQYDARAAGSTASGAYQIIDSFWNGYDGYDRAVLAPPEVQDQFAYEAFTALLKRHGNDVSTIPVVWYIGHVPQGDEWDTVPLPEAGNVLTPREYQAKWMEKFFSLLSEGAPVYLPSDTEDLIPAIAFPVLGPVEFVDDWHFERDGGTRLHEGLDLLGYEGQPIRAVFDGVITKIDDNPAGIAGNGLRLTRDDGLYANYFHLSNSEVGPVLSTLEVGTRVRAGQIIGFMGSTGNAGIPHLHFELRTAEREPMAPYPAILEAVQREQCTVGLGPWSTEFVSPAEQAEAEAAALEELAAMTEEQREGLRAYAEAVEAQIEYITIEGPDGAQWVVGTDGSVTASGEAAMIGTYQADCPMPIETTDDDGDPIMYGTEANGLAVDELPVGWWDDDAVEWEPDLDAEYVDPWVLDQADLDVAHENHVDPAETDEDGEALRSFVII